MKTSIVTLLLAFVLAFPVTGRVARAADAAVVPQDRTAAVIVAYQRIGEDEYPAASIGQDNFSDHITELEKGGYKVMALPDVIAAFKAGATLPPKTVVLTFDGGHRSVLEKAVPLLLKENLPFTVFVATEHMDRQAPEYISWDELKKLASNKLVTIGLHPSSYGLLVESSADEVKRQINNARTSLRDKLGIEAKYFAYPSGEISAAYRDIVAASGFDAALGQQSGVAYAGSDLYALPRFVMTESYGDLDRFRMTVNALPLPVTDVEPKDPHLTTMKPAIGFTVDAALTSALPHLACFVPGQGKPQIQTIGKNRVEVRLEKDLENDRVRINCTLPGPMSEDGEEQRWRWFGMLLTVPQPQDESASDDNDMPDGDTAPASGGGE
ncbi:MAG TPA: polysaccharide deacetylase family protein [Patescibacteria group bacterium]|nr:polysaccharide deacetylase family protein [Patescibacteria group bacterium]